MKRLFALSLLAASALFATNAQAVDSQYSYASGSNFTQTFTFTPSETVTLGAPIKDWFSFSITANAADFGPFSYTLTGDNGASFSNTIAKVYGSGNTAIIRGGFADKADTPTVQDFTAGHNYSLSISGKVKSGGEKSYLLTLNNATFVTAVPEPEAYAMLLAGLGLMGAVARRRSQAKA